MKSIRVDSLLPNIYFDQPVFLDEKFIILSPDIPTDEALVERLKRFNFEKVYTDGNPSHTAISETGEEHKTVEVNLEENLKEKQITDEVFKFYFDFLNFTKEKFLTIIQRHELNINLASEKIKEALEYVKNNKDVILRFNELKIPADNYLYNHSVNSTLLALAVGLTLKLPPHRLIELGLAAWLHDIGMFKLPPQLYLTDKKLDLQERKSVLAHTVAGYKLLKSLSVPEDVAVCCLEHHERADGSGYPRALKAEQISLYGKIIGLLCSFDALISERPYKDAMDGHHGLVDLLKNHKTKYDETILKALIITISLYPVGTYVQLSNKAIGVVAKTNPHNPRCPVVKVLFDKDGKQLVEPVLIPTTSQADGLSIVRVLAEQEKGALQLDQEKY